MNTDKKQMRAGGTPAPRSILRALVLVGVMAGWGFGQATTRPAKLPAVPDDVEVVWDVAYLGDARAEKADLYLPKGRPAGVKSPAVVMIHGGGWVGGDKRASREVNVGLTLASKGYVCLSVNYEMRAGHRWPNNLLDCKNGVRFLRAKAGEYGVDVGRIGVMGGSAGGHLALMVGYTTGVEGLEPEDLYPGVSSRVACVVDLYGITNLLTRKQAAEDGTPGEVRGDKTALLTVSKTEDRAAWEKASPVFHVEKGRGVPTLILQGDGDATVDRDQSYELAGKLKAAGVEHELIVLPGVGHTFDLETWKRKKLPRDLRPVVVGWFDRYLKGKVGGK